MKIVTALAALACLGAQDKVDLKVGDPAPAFEAQDDQGKPWKSADHVGKHIVVLYFYPASFTGGCTKQACGFRDDMKEFANQDIEVIGVSADEVATQEAFKRFHHLNFTLLADPKGEVAKAFGVPTKKGGVAKATIDGKPEQFTRSMTILRWTFILDKSGKVAFKNSEVKAAEDSKAVLKVIEGLK